MDQVTQEETASWDHLGGEGELADEEEECAIQHMFLKCSLYFVEISIGEHHVLFI